MKHTRRTTQRTSDRGAETRGPLIALPAQARLCDVTDVLFQKDQDEFPVLDGDRIVGALRKGELLRALSRRDPCSPVVDLLVLPAAATRTPTEKRQPKRRRPALGAAPTFRRRRNLKQGERTSWVEC